MPKHQTTICLNWLKTLQDNTHRINVFLCHCDSKWSTFKLEWFYMIKIQTGIKLFSSVMTLINDNNNDRIERPNSRFLLSPHCTTTCLQHVCSSGQGTVVCKSHATHQALITCNMSYAMWYEGTTQLLNLTEVKLAYMSVYSIGWNHQAMMCYWLKALPDSHYSFWW